MAVSTGRPHRSSGPAEPARPLALPLEPRLPRRRALAHHLVARPQTPASGRRPRDGGGGGLVPGGATGTGRSVPARRPGGAAGPVRSGRRPGPRATGHTARSSALPLRLSPGGAGGRRGRRHPDPPHRAAGDVRRAQLPPGLPRPMAGPRIVHPVRAADLLLLPLGPRRAVRTGAGDGGSLGRGRHPLVDGRPGGTLRSHAGRAPGGKRRRRHVGRRLLRPDAGGARRRRLRDRGPGGGGVDRCGPGGPHRA